MAFDAVATCVACGAPSNPGNAYCSMDCLKIARRMTAARLARTLTTEVGVSLDEVEDELVYLFEEVGADDNIPALTLARRVIAILTRIKNDAPRD